MTIICAISTLFVNNVLTFEDRIFWVLIKIPQNYIPKKYRSEGPVLILGQTSGHTYLQSTSIMFTGQFNHF